MTERRSISQPLRRLALKRRNDGANTQDPDRKPQARLEAARPVGQRAAQHRADALAYSEHNGQYADRGRHGMRLERAARERRHGGEDGEKRASEENGGQIGAGRRAPDRAAPRFRS